MAVPGVKTPQQLAEEQDKETRAAETRASKLDQSLENRGTFGESTNSRSRASQKRRQGTRDRLLGNTPTFTQSEEWMDDDKTKIGIYGVPGSESDESTLDGGTMKEVDVTANSGNKNTDAVRSNYRVGVPAVDKPVKDPSEVTSKPSGTSYEEWYKASTESPVMSEEQLKKLRRRETAQKVIAGLGDLGAAVANMWGASRGAVPLDLEPRQMSPKYKEKWDQWRKDYRENMNKYIEGLNNAKKLDWQQYKYEKDYAMKEAKEDRLRAAQEAKDENSKLSNELLQARIDHMNTTDEHQKELLKLRMQELEEKKRVNDTVITKNQAMAEHYRKMPAGGGRRTVMRGVEYSSVEEAYANIPDRTLSDILDSIEGYFAGSQITQSVMRIAISKYNAMK